MDISRLPQADIPLVLPVRQSFLRPLVADLEEATISALSKLVTNQAEIAGKRIGLTAPSRGIRDIAEVLRFAVSWLKSQGASPVILTAMGTHGGGTTLGNLEMARDRGIDETKTGAPVLADMATSFIDTVGGVTVSVAQDALSCDGVILVNRLKEHTDINWPSAIAPGFFGLESGWAKILALGLSHLNALKQHQHVYGIGLGAAIELSAARIIDGRELRIIGGLGIIENAYDETASIVSARAGSAAEFFAAEAEALRYSKSLMPKLPFKTVDVLWSHWLGKDLSGQGMHTKTIGRSPYGYQQGVPWLEGSPGIFNIIGSALTPGSHGNAIGAGLCEFITKRFDEAVDWERTTLNSLTALAPCQARRPVVLNNDRDALRVAIAVSPEVENPRLVLMHSTLKLAEMLVSKRALEDSRAEFGDVLEVVGEEGEVPFTGEGYVDWVGVFGEREH